MAQREPASCQDRRDSVAHCDCPWCFGYGSTVLLPERFYDLAEVVARSRATN